MKKSILFPCILLCLLSISVWGQDGPKHSPKLTTEKGFNLLKIGAKLADVKSVLKDTISLKNSWEPDEEMEQIAGIYLVDLTKPGYSKFQGKDIDRIEVYFTTVFSDDEKPMIWHIKMFFKKISKQDCDTFFNKLVATYGSSSPTLDDPRQGDESITWFSTEVMMTAISYAGYEDAPNDKYFKVEFYSSQGG